MTQRKSIRMNLNRRQFVVGAMAVPLVANVPLPAAAPVASAKEAAHISLAEFTNMNSYQMWRWQFDLVRAADGSFTLLSEQHHDDPDDEPWEIEPMEGLQNGADTYHALHSQVGFVNCHVPEHVIEDTEKALRKIDPRLADDFLLASEEREI